jgi:hypothetical protein
VARLKREDKDITSLLMFLSILNNYIFNQSLHHKYSGLNVINNKVNAFEEAIACHRTASHDLPMTTLSRNRV